MHMVGHHHELADIHMGHVLRDGVPALLGYITQCVSHHHPVLHTAEQLPHVFGAYRHETCLPAGRYAPSLA